MEYYIDRNKLNSELDIKFYDELKKVDDDEYWIFAQFVFSKDIFVRQKLLKYMLSGKRSRYDVSSTSAIIGMRYKLGVYQYKEWGLID